MVPTGRHAAPVSQCGGVQPGALTWPRPPLPRPPPPSSRYPSPPLPRPRPPPLEFLGGSCRSSCTGETGAERAAAAGWPGVPCPSVLDARNGGAGSSPIVKRCNASTTMCRHPYTDSSAPRRRAQSCSGLQSGSAPPPSAGIFASLRSLHAPTARHGRSIDACAVGLCFATARAMQQHRSGQLKARQAGEGREAAGAGDNPRLGSAAAACGLLPTTCEHDTVPLQGLQRAPARCSTSSAGQLAAERRHGTHLPCLGILLVRAACWPPPGLCPSPLLAAWVRARASRAAQAAKRTRSTYGSAAAQRATE